MSRAPAPQAARRDVLVSGTASRRGSGGPRRVRSTAREALQNASRIGHLSFLSERGQAGHLRRRAGDPRRRRHAAQPRRRQDDAAGRRRDADAGRARPHPARARRTRAGDRAVVITVYDRDGEPAMELGGYNSYFGTGSDLMSTYDLETGEHRPSVLEDVRRAARLCDALPNIDFVMSSAHPTDQDPHLSYLLSFVAMLQNTDEAAGDDGRERARPGRDDRDRARPARRPRRAPRQAVLPHVQRADQPADASARQRREAAAVRRRRRADQLLAGAAGRGHGAHHRRRSHGAGHRRVPVRPRRAPVAHAGRAVPVRHGLGRARHRDRAVQLQRPRLPARLHVRRGDGQVARPAQLGQRRHQRQPACRTRRWAWRPTSSRCWPCWPAPTSRTTSATSTSASPARSRRS